MKHLCKICASLSIDQHTATSLRKLSEKETTTHVISELMFANIYDLEASARGRGEGSPCHLCLLLLRSLKDHRTVGTAVEETSLPDGVISLLVRISTGRAELVASVGGSEGYPLTISTEFDDACRGQEVSSSADSSEVFSLIKNWCSVCLHEHEGCTEIAAKESWLPDRVIDVGPQDGSADPYLFTSRGQAGRYIALTHRWNSKNVSSTTSLNFDARSRKIPMAELSSTFQDAIYLTRKLDVRYLWIDAICIIQDSTNDWKRQSSNMMSIYELSWLNISVAGSEVEPGCFLRRTPRLSRRCRLPSSMSKLLAVLPEYQNDSGQGIYVHLDSEFYAKSIYDGFISRRGWIFQERILSPRTVYFGKEEIYWECSKLAASESFPWGYTSGHFWPLVKMRSRKVARASRPFDPSGMIYHIMISLDEAYNYWYKIVESYSCLTLTKHTDALAAILGLAQAIHKSQEGRAFADEYLDGIWLSDIQRGLLWYPASDTEDARSEPSSCFPSYSWASHDGPVKFQEIREQHLTVTRTYDLPNVLLTAETLFRINKRPVVWTVQSRHGLQVWGFLQVGTLKFGTPDSNSSRNGTVISDTGEEICSATLDRRMSCDNILKSWFEESEGLVCCFHSEITRTESCKLKIEREQIWNREQNKLTPKIESLEEELSILEKKNLDVKKQGQTAMLPWYVKLKQILEPKSTEEELNEKIQSLSTQKKYFEQKIKQLKSGKAVSVDVSSVGLLLMPMQNKTELTASLARSAMEPGASSPEDPANLHFQRIGLVIRKPNSLSEMIDNGRILESIVLF